MQISYHNKLKLQQNYIKKIELTRKTKQKQKQNKAKKTPEETHSKTK